MGQLEDMNVFIRVIESGGIGAAADQLGIAKSAVSRRLADLEARLGVTLINRTTRRSSVTETGTLYYKRAVQILGEVAELNTQASGAHTSLQGTLRLAAPLSFGNAHLTPALDEFIHQHPELTLQVDFSDQRVDIVGGGYDMAFRIGELADSSLQARRVSPIRFIVCASPGYLKKKGTPTSPDDLGHHHLLHYNDARAWKLLDSNKKESVVHVDARMVVNNGDFLREMAISDHGIVLSPTFIVWQALAEGALVPVLPGYTVPSSHAYVVYPKQRYLPQPARLLTDHLVDRFGDQPYWDQGL